MQQIIGLLVGSDHIVAEVATGTDWREPRMRSDSVAQWISVTHLVAHVQQAAQRQAQRHAAVVRGKGLHIFQQEVAGTVKVRKAQKGDDLSSAAATAAAAVVATTRWGAVKPAWVLSKNE
jgi:dissimilatory sulfite reductase (desulfoviridin) alpha/beta subunit